MSKVIQILATDEWLYTLKEDGEVRAYYTQRAWGSGDVIVSGELTEVGGDGSNE